VDDLRCTPACENAYDVEAYGVEVRFLRGQVLFGEGAYGGLLASGDSLERAAEGRPPAQLDLREDEGVGSNVQTRTAPELVFHALLTQDGAQRLELARA
jgi:hypothetical protein